MITYSLSSRGPLPNDWVKKNGDNWTTGKVEVLPQGELFGKEHFLEIMDKESWRQLTIWLRDLTTKTGLNKEDLLNRFEKETSHEIKYFKRKP